MMATVLRCECGRKWSDCTYAVMRSGVRRLSFYRCECGREWTVQEDAPDPLDPVTSDEVLEVHRLLGVDGSLDELLKAP